MSLDSYLNPPEPTEDTCNMCDCAECQCDHLDDENTDNQIQVNQ